MRSSHCPRGLPNEWSQTSPYTAVCRHGRADSRATMRLFATASAEALLSPESAQPHNWQRTEPLRNPVRPFQLESEHPKPPSRECGAALGESRASRNLSVHSSDQYPDARCIWRVLASCEITESLTESYRSIAEACSPESRAGGRGLGGLESQFARTWETCHCRSLQSSYAGGG
jgi:hypothetical protein